MGTTSPPPIITVEARAPGRRGEAAAVARRVDGRLVGAGPVGPDELRLVLAAERIELHDSMSGAGGTAIDFTRIDRRVGAGNLSRKQLLPRAVGRTSETIVDATAGWGFDACLLACMGYQVEAIERCPVAVVLVEDALRRAAVHAELGPMLEGRLGIREGDACRALPELPDAPDTVYLDPMFPPSRRASALPRKRVQLLRRLVGADTDADMLFEAAMDAARRRVVVKRADDAPPLHDAVSFVQQGKLVRYDVYMRNSIHG